MVDHAPAFALGADAGERVGFGPGALIVRASAETTSGAVTIFEEVEPLLDTPSHVHEREDELYYVLEGEHVYQCGEQEFSLGPGGLVFLPRGVPHAHRRVVQGVGRLLCLTSPAGLEGFFRMLAEADRASTPVPAAYAAASERYGIRWLE